MLDGVVVVLVPVAAEALLIGLCVGVWVRLRRLGIGGVYQLTLVALVVDGLSQGWQLGLRVGRSAGVVWLVHIILCAMMLYILYRLGELLARMRQVCPPPELIKERVLVEEGG